MTSGPGWFDPVGDEVTDRRAGAVHAALLTTYDPPDATLLVEELLPCWFDLDREMSSDDAANRFFLAELETNLQRRRGKLAVFSSAALLGPESQHWIWSHVDRHFVGARGSVVQHAKLWLFHRVDEDGAERLDIHVSSTNLTRSAVREQVQAGFRCLALLGPTTSRAALRSWGALVPFLEELGSHAGPAGVVGGRALASTPRADADVLKALSSLRQCPAHTEEAIGVSARSARRFAFLRAPRSIYSCPRSAVGPKTRLRHGQGRSARSRNALALHGLAKGIRGPSTGNSRCGRRCA